MATVRLSQSNNHGGQMKRRFGSESVTLNHTAADSDVIDLRDFADAIVVFPDDITAEDVAIYVCDTVTGTFVPLHSADGTAQVVAASENRAQRLPDAAFAAGFVKLVPATDDYDVVVMAKS